MGIKMRFWAVILVILGVMGASLFAQTDLAATLEVLEGDVSVQRVNTSTFIPITIEAIVGVGDVIQTGNSGRARITFFADGTDTELLPNTTYRIEAFSGNATTFQLSVEVILGQTSQRLGRVLDANSSYNVNTQGMTMAARGTVFSVRVEESGRAGMLVQEGVVEADKDDDLAQVPPQFGVRAEAEGALSDVVRATTFDELDAALDGCSVTVTTSDDVSINVRVSPNTTAEQLGIVEAFEISTLFGKSETGNWYRITFEDSYGWILSSTTTFDDTCAGLRIFPSDYIEGQDLTPSIEPEATPDTGS